MARLGLTIPWTGVDFDVVGVEELVRNIVEFQEGDATTTLRVQGNVASDLTSASLPPATDKLGIERHTCLVLLLGWNDSWRYGAPCRSPRALENGI